MAFVIEELVVDTISWTPYAPSDDAHVIAVYNKDTSSDLKFRTNSSDPTTEIVIPAGIQESLGANSNTAATAPRFSRNVTVGFFQAVSGTGPVKIKRGR